MADTPEKLGPKLVQFPKPQPKPEPLPPPAQPQYTPQQEILLGLYGKADRIKNLSVFVHFEDGHVEVQQVLQDDMDLWSFVDAIRLRALQATNDAMAPPAPEQPRPRTS